MLQQDTTSVHSAGIAQGDNAPAQYRPLTPARVLSWLPRNATPAQQDSAIQAHFKPSEIRWSTRPDTLHLPGHDKGRNLLDVQLPQYYREGFFSKDSLFHPELPGGRYGAAGDPVPYSVRGDNVITALLLLCFMLAIIAFSNVRAFIVRQAKSFVYPAHSGTMETNETANEVRFQVFLVILTALLVALLYYLYTIHFITSTFVLSSQYILIAIFWAIIMVYFLVKQLLYGLINNVFFDSKRNLQWQKSMLFIIAIEGVLLYPAVTLQAYFDLSIQTTIYYFGFVLVFVKLLTLFKCYSIFFRQNVVSLQIILYLCALEIVPLLTLWSILDLTANSLKINY